MQKEFWIAPLALLLAAGSVRADKSDRPDPFNPDSRTWDAIELDIGAGVFCDTFTVEATQWGGCSGSTCTYLTFSLDETLCDWSISSCGDLSADTAFWLYHDDDRVARNDDYNCVDELACISYTPAAIGTAWGDECLEAGDYILQVKVYSSFDPQSCVQRCEDAPFELCFVLGPEGGDTASAAEQPGGFALQQNYPNPFNPATRLEFTLPETSFARLAVHDLTGALVRTLVEEVLSRGKHSLHFEAGSLPSGAYLLRLEAGELKATRKMLLVR